MDHTTLHPASANRAHHIDLHLWNGAPENTDEDHPVQILVNEGYVVGFCPSRLQPAWSAYRVATADDDVDYKRPLLYYDDMRLPEEHRIGNGTFGRLADGTQLNVGHMTPNEVINRQYGRLAQMETFYMSNMSPQYGAMNRGIWATLEGAIRSMEDFGDEKGHVWVIVGPVFDGGTDSVSRGSGKHIPVPDAYFCVTVDPENYPYKRESNCIIDWFLIRQSDTGNPLDCTSSKQEIEQLTGLRFFPGWGVMQSTSPEDPPIAQAAGQRKSRMRAALERIALNPSLVPGPENGNGSGFVEVTGHGKGYASPAEPIPAPSPSLDNEPNAGLSLQSLEALIAMLEQEANHMQIVGRALSPAEEHRLDQIYRMLAMLGRARDVVSPPAPPAPPKLITYKIASDVDGKLKEAARIACNFWNGYVAPPGPTVIRLESYRDANGGAGPIALAYMPYHNGGTTYGRVTFNRHFLETFTANQIAGTIVHEIGHTLGLGFGNWHTLFDANTGKFTAEAIHRLPGLASMEVEREGGDSTALAHWDEDRFPLELMSGWKNVGREEHVLPITIEVMALLGNTVTRSLEQQTSLTTLLNEASTVLFSRHREAESIDVDHFEETPLLEKYPHDPKS